MRIYYGWIVVIAAAVAYMCVLGVTLHSFGLYVIPVSKELGYSRAEMNTAYALISIGNGAMAPLIGRLLDRYPARAIMTIGAVLMCLGLIILSNTESLWLKVFALAFLIPSGIDAGAFITMSVVVARWFTIHRTRAIALSTLGQSLGGIVVPPISALLIQSFGWRTTLEIVGTSAMVLLLAIALLVIREHPGDSDQESETPRVVTTEQRAIENGKKLSVKEILAAPRFWLITLSTSLAVGTGAASTVSLVPLSSDKGLTMLEATSLITIMGAMAVSSKIILAWLFNKSDLAIVGAVLFILAIPRYMVLIFAHSYASFIVAAIIMGLTSGVAPTLMQGLLADRFGTASFGILRGLGATVNAIVVAISIRYAGEVFDRTGGYYLMFITFMVLNFVAATMAFAVRRSKILSDEQL